MDKEGLKKAWEEAERDRLENNDKILQIPSGLSPKGQAAYSSIAETIKKSIKYRLTSVDAELIWRYCQLKVMRDRAWRAYTHVKKKILKIISPTTTI